MPQTIIRDRRLADDDWRTLDMDSDLPDGDRVIVDWERWQSLLDGAQADDGRLPHVGVRLPNTIDPAEAWPCIAKRPLIALEFPAFADGRAYSQARLLRERYGFAGELRAVGAAVVHDQIAGMARCGFSAFVLREDQDAQRCLSAFEDFGTAYQPACDDVAAIWQRRRAAQPEA